MSSSTHSQFHGRSTENSFEKFPWNSNCIAGFSANAIYLSPRHAMYMQHIFDVVSFYTQFTGSSVQPSLAWLDSTRLGSAWSVDRLIVWLKSRTQPHIFADLMLPACLPTYHQLTMCSTRSQSWSIHYYEPQLWSRRMHKSAASEARDQMWRY